jgi:hypothetical protein
MNESQKEIIFYVIIFLLFYVLSKSSGYVGTYFKLNNDVSLLLFSLVFTGVVFLLKNLGNKDNFYFELTPEKHCEGGSYLYSSDPVKKKFCSQFSKSDIANYSCCNGFHGAPVHWERTSMSDDKWNNKMCDGNFKEYTDPQVL